MMNAFSYACNTLVTIGDSAFSLLLGLTAFCSKNAKQYQTAVSNLQHPTLLQQAALKESFVNGHLSDGRQSDNTSTFPREVMNSPVALVQRFTRWAEELRQWMGERFGIEPVTHAQEPGKVQRTGKIAPTVTVKETPTKKGAASFKNGCAKAFSKIVKDNKTAARAASASNPYEPRCFQRWRLHCHHTKVASLRRVRHQR